MKRLIAMLLIVVALICNKFRPKEEPAKKSGLWKLDMMDGEPYKDEIYETVYKCSICGTTEIGAPKFCSHCGAEMSVEESNDT